MRFRLAAALLAASFGPLSGCSHVEIVRELNGQKLSPEGRTIAHINASSWGIYLLYWVPLVSGSRDHPGRFSLFRHTANAEDVIGLLTRTSRDMGATCTADLQSWTDSWWLGWSLVFWMRGTYASGNAIASSPSG